MPMSAAERKRAQRERERIGAGPAPKGRPKGSGDDFPLPAWAGLYLDLFDPAREGGLQRVMRDVFDPLFGTPERMPERVAVSRPVGGLPTTAGRTHRGEVRQLVTLGRAAELVREGWRVGTAPMTAQDRGSGTAPIRRGIRGLEATPPAPRESIRFRPLHPGEEPARGSVGAIVALRHRLVEHRAPSGKLVQVPDWSLPGNGWWGPLEVRVIRQLPESGRVRCQLPTGGKTFDVDRECFRVIERS